MVAYSFNPRFIEPIRQGMKTQTIRAHGLRRHARPGEMLQLYSGMRTAHCVKILPDVRCLAVETVWFKFIGKVRPLIDRVVIDNEEVIDLDAFAVQDGFADRLEMGEFWHIHHPAVIDAGEFHGVLIEWARPAETMLGVAA